MRPGGNPVACSEPWGRSCTARWRGAVRVMLMTATARSSRTTRTVTVPTPPVYPVALAEQAPQAGPLLLDSLLVGQGLPGRADATVLKRDDPRSSPRSAPHLFQRPGRDLPIRLSQREVVHG